MTKQSSIPCATYRLQFTPQFGLCDAQKILPYLEQLGISHIYASPVTRARSGSMHGYDVCDSREVNPELGTFDQFLCLLRDVAGRGMGWLQDCVPNHRAFSHENPRLVDVLEHGIGSRFSRFFDITWEHHRESLHRRVLVPFLGKPYGHCVLDNELHIVKERGGLWVAYYEHRFPLSPESYWTVYGEKLNEHAKQLDKDNDAYTTLCGALHTLKNSTGVADALERSTQCAMAKSVLQGLCDRNPVIQDYTTRCIQCFDTAIPGGVERFDRLMAEQNYRLAYWKVAAEELNYRRFFTISDLICIRVEYQEVFDQTHGFLFDLIDQGLISGLRIDHIDGLFDPATYLQRLHQRLPHALLFVEKILDTSEHCPESWPVQGTTGYDFCTQLGALFCNQQAGKRFTALYERFIQRRIDSAALRIEKKRLIIGKHMAGDIDNLARLVLTIAGTDLLGRDITLYGLRRALVEVLTHFPVYRTYISTTSFTDDDARVIAKALGAARTTMAGLAIEFDFIERFLMMKGTTRLDDQYGEAWKQAVMRFQQFTGPLMAKGFEDTFFYVYNRHIALNEVGGRPEQFGIPLRTFQRFFRHRAGKNPLSMNTTATHDTKRGEDTRARMHVLTEMPAEWARRVQSWQRYNRIHATKKGRTISPDRNDEYHFYQTVVGTFPLDNNPTPGYVNRLKDYMLKAVKEAKVHTAWIKPDEDYEQAVVRFVEQCLDREKSPFFLDDLQSFAHSLSWFGMMNSITQAVCKMTLPGVPDFYQGSELWDFSLVDPDNRRPVDFSMRETMLTTLTTNPLSLDDLLSSLYDGRIKMFCIHRCLQARRRWENLFTKGTYKPVTTCGSRKRYAVAFGRTYGTTAMLTLVPRITSHLVEAGHYPHGGDVWTTTRLLIPPYLREKTCVNIFTGRKMRLERDVAVGDVLDVFPVAVLVRSDEPGGVAETNNSAVKGLQKVSE